MDLQVQLTEFAVTLLIGIVLGIIFDFYRIFRGVFHPKKLMTILGDTLYWVIALVLTFASLLYNNWAQMRFYIFFGLIVGALVYYFCISRYIVFSLFYIIRRIIFLFKSVKSLVFTVIVQPLAYCLGICAVPFRWGYKRLCRERTDVEKKSNNT